MAEFRAWPKTPRLMRDCVITEKIDGTNAAVVIVPAETGDGALATVSGFSVFAQSRNRFVTPDKDNYGFAEWVNRYAAELVHALGEGYHYGEWWGAGIQRGYGMTGKRFSLFNTSRWEGVTFPQVPDMGMVPILYRGPFSTDVVSLQLESLRQNGSIAAEGFAPAEGVIVYLSAARQVFKVLLDHDERPKGA